VMASLYELSFIDFVGTLWCRLQVGTDLDLRILHSSSTGPGGTSFNRSIRGTIGTGPIRQFRVTHSGSGFVAAHRGFLQHDVTGGATMSDGAELTIDEQIYMGFTETCYSSYGSHSTNWYQVYRNTLSVGDDDYALNGRIGGAAGGDCGHYGPLPAEFWGALGTVTKNGAWLGELGLGSPTGDNVPDVELYLDELGTLTFRRAGLLPTAVFIHSPFSY
ncbi:MAG: hypothetical protein FD129_537, partial [bacterium]